MATKKALSLFSGMGGDTLGMSRTGVDVVSYSELKAYIQKTHEANFPDSNLLGGDITKVTDDALRQLGTRGIDIIFAGFPCQGLSNAGKKLPDDPRNTLFREFVRCTHVLQPDLIIGENVKGLLSRQTEDGRSYIDVIVEEFEKMNYSVIFKVCKAHLYGVPQKRERLIIIGVKKNRIEDFNLSFPEENSVESAPNLKNIVSFGMTGAVAVPAGWFEGIPEECILTDMENDEDAQGAHPYLLSKVQASGDKLSYAGKSYTMLFSFGKRISPIHCEIVDIRLPAKTIICTFEHQPRLFIPLRNKNGCYLRCMSPHELKQIQGFPADYTVSGNVKEQIIQIGNAVPPPLIEKIVRHVCNA